MRKTDKVTAVLTTVVCLIPVVAGFILYSQLPDQIAIHWNTQGIPDGFAGKFVAAIALPLGLVIVNLAVQLFVSADPKYENMGRRPLGVIYWLTPALSLMCSGATLASALGAEVPIELAAPLMVGAILIAIGNYLPKIGQNYSLGIKLPWTLASADNWRRTHRVAGFVWVAAGIAVLASSFVSPLRMWALITCAAAIIVVPIVYSYLLHRREHVG